MSNNSNTMKTQSKSTENNTLIIPYEKQDCLPIGVMTFEYHIKYLMECSEHNNWGITHYFLEKVMESFHDIDVKI